MSNTVARAEMLIRKPVHEVFAALCEPPWLERYWLRRASAPLAAGAVVDWEFMVEGARETVTVTAFVADQRIDFDWSDGTAVRLRFATHQDAATRVSVSASGFTGDDAAAQAVSATEGFSIVLCDLKCLLETGQPAGLVADKAALIMAGHAGDG